MPQEDSKHRKTRKRSETPNEARYLTFSCYNRLTLFSNDKIKSAFIEAISDSRQRTHFRLFAWVIMPEHCHLLIQPDLREYPVSVVLKDLKGNFSNKVLRRWRELDAKILSKVTDNSGKQHFWLAGGRHDLNLYTDEKLIQKIEYTHDNPVRRGLVAYAIDWLWSSARWYYGIRDECPLEIDPIPF